MINITLVPTPPFERELKQLAKKYPSLHNDLAELEVQLLENPSQGTSIGQNCFKFVWQFDLTEKENQVEQEL